MNIYIYIPYIHIIPIFISWYYRYGTVRYGTVRSLFSDADTLSKPSLDEFTGCFVVPAEWVIQNRRENLIVVGIHPRAAMNSFNLGTGRDCHSWMTFVLASVLSPRGGAYSFFLHSPGRRCVCLCVILTKAFDRIQIWLSIQTTHILNDTLAMATAVAEVVPSHSLRLRTLLGKFDGWRCHWVSPDTVVAPFKTMMVLSSLHSPDWSKGTSPLW